MWSMKGSASAPSSATINGARWAITVRQKGDVSGESVELGDNDRALAGLTGRQRRREPRTAIQCIGSLAGFCFDELGGEDEAFGFGETGNGGTLCLDA